MAQNGKTQIKNDLSVAQSGTSSFNVNLGNCSSFNMAFIPDATHTYKVEVIWDGLFAEDIISSASQGNKLSAIVSVKTPYAVIKITNSDVGAAHTYDVFLYKHE